MTDFPVAQFPCIKSIIVFGSRARGDADSRSDLDLCVITETLDYDQLLKLRSDFSKSTGVAADTLSIYGYHTAIGMAEAGSLFLWHLSSEGKVLYDRDACCSQLFRALVPFTEYKPELDIYEGLLVDVERSLNGRRELLEIDLHVLQLIVRNVSILLTYHSGQVQFGRVGAFKAAKASYPEFPVSPEMYQELSEWHLAYLRGTTAPHQRPSAKGAQTYVDAVRGAISFAREKVA
jgi:predicted nucleotidyltransferase